MSDDEGAPCLRVRYARYVKATFRKENASGRLKEGEGRRVVRSKFKALLVRKWRKKHGQVSIVAA